VIYNTTRTSFFSWKSDVAWRANEAKVEAELTLIDVGVDEMRRDENGDED
jgi:hypothetical protein